MESIKEEAIKAISKLPESATVDDIMYELYVIEIIHGKRDFSSVHFRIAGK